MIMHPLDEKYWSREEYWRWWGYKCPADPRLVVSKRPRWAGYTVNFGHKHALLFLITSSILVLIPIMGSFLIASGNRTLITTICVIAIVLMLILCHRAANPKSWRENEFPGPGQRA